MSTLINMGWISSKKIEKEIEDEKFILLYVLAKSIKISSRLYPKDLIKMGFIRLEPLGKYWAIAEKNLSPKKLRDLNTLSEYLLLKSKKWVESVELTPPPIYLFTHLQHLPTPLLMIRLKLKPKAFSGFYMHRIQSCSEFLYTNHFDLIIRWCQQVKIDGVINGRFQDIHLGQ